MGWSAFATRLNGIHLPTILRDGEIELMDSDYREKFHAARDRVLALTGKVDADLYRGGLGLTGCGRVLSLLAGHGGSIAELASFGAKDVTDMSHATDMLSLDFVKPKMVMFGFDGDEDPVESYYWSTIELVRTCATFGLGIECERH